MPRQEVYATRSAGCKPVPALTDISSHDGSTVIPIAREAAAKRGPFEAGKGFGLGELRSPASRWRGRKIVSEEAAEAPKLYDEMVETAKRGEGTDRVKLGEQGKLALACNVKSYSSLTLSFVSAHGSPLLLKRLKESLREGRNYFR